MKSHNKNVPATKPNWALIGGIVAVIALAAVGIIMGSKSGPAPTELAACISAAGAVMYGAHWCPHCAEQKKLFGDAFEQVMYVECATGGPKNIPAQPALCKEKGIESYPTWIFADGSKQTGVVSLAQLAAKTGCTAALPKG